MRDVHVKAELVTNKTILKAAQSDQICKKSIPMHSQKQNFLLLRRYYCAAILCKDLKEKRKKSHIAKLLSFKCYYVKANIHSGKFQPVRYGIVHFLLFSENVSCSREEIYSENKRKCTIPYRTG